MTKRKPPPIDRASDAIVLFYVGEGPIYGDAPARDLNAADLARLVRIAKLRESGGEYVTRATDHQLEAMAEQLTSSGAFTREAPGTDVDDDNEAPAAPAKENA
jgi:hypothetical protein